MLHHRMRALVVGLVGACSLIVASTASAAFTSPRLFASQPDQANRISLLYTQSTADDPVAKIVHFIPRTYMTNLEARPLGTLVGSAVLRGNPVDRVGNAQPGTNLVLSGTVETVRADTVFQVNGRNVRMSQAATDCTGKGLNEFGQYWLIRLKDAGGDVVYDLPAFAERRTPETAFGADATISVCFRPSDVPASNANRAPAGFEVREFDLRLTRVFTSPKKGDHRFSTLVTPYSPRSGRANDAGTVEVQSVVAYPRAVSLNAPVRVRMTKGFATWRFSGSVVTPATHQPTVSLFRGFNKTHAGARSAQAYKIGTSAGRYTIEHTIKRVPKAQTFFFQVRAYVANQVQGRAGCVVNLHPNIQCIQATRAGYMIRSRTVMVRVPAN
ncbi:MAG TPA: hypothetical protein VM204_06565 [Gaiellaceae bacterium]|nr:hypothetical protein [Gaiellaceae bacterium]